MLKQTEPISMWIVTSLRTSGNDVYPKVAESPISNTDHHGLGERSL